MNNILDHHHHISFLVLAYPLGSVSTQYLGTWYYSEGGAEWNGPDRGPGSATGSTLSQRSFFWPKAARTSAESGDCGSCAGVDCDCDSDGIGGSGGGRGCGGLFASGFGFGQKGDSVSVRCCRCGGRFASIFYLSFWL